MTRRTFRIRWTFGLGINFNIDLTLKPNSGEFARVHMNSPAIVPAAMVPPGLTLNFCKRTSVSSGVRPNSVRDELRQTRSKLERTPEFGGKIFQ